MKVQSDIERAISDFAWNYLRNMCGGEEYSAGCVDAGIEIVASTATTIQVRLWEVFIAMTPDKNLEGIGLPAQLHYAEHKLEFEWPSAKDCEELADSGITCDFSPFDVGARASSLKYESKGIPMGSEL